MEILNDKYKKITIILITAICGSTIFANDTTFKEYTFGNFRDMANEIIKLNTKYNNDSTERIIQLNHPSYINYYLNRLGHKDLRFAQYVNHGENEQLMELKKIVQESKKNYFINAYFMLQSSIDDIIKAKYPFVTDNINSTGYNIRIYSTHQNKNVQKCLLELNNDFENEDSWSAPKSFDIQNPISGAKSFIVTNKMEYGPTIKIPYSELKKAKYFVCTTDFIADTVLADISFDYSVSRDDKTISWQSRPFRFFNAKNKLSKYVFTANFPEEIKDSDIVAIYISNGKHESLKIDNISIRFY